MSLHTRSECGEEILRKAHDLAVCVDNALLEEVAQREHESYLNRNDGTANSDDKFNQWWITEGQYFDDNIDKLTALQKSLDWLQENV